MISSITSQPFLVSLILVVAILYFIYTLLGLLRIQPLNRILSLIPILLLLSVFYMGGSPLLATLLLSVGFLASFLLAFTMLAGTKK